jgi:hypothetical protein
VPGNAFPHLKLDREPTFRPEVSGFVGPLSLPIRFNSSV